jgi:hypothetical protein
MSIATGRIQGSKGADVASANAMTLGIDGNYFDITGTTTINTISGTGWSAGSIITMQFDSTPTVTHAAGGSGQMFLTGAGNFSATAGDTLTLICEGTAWREIARAVI